MDPKSVAATSASIRTVVELRQGGDPVEVIIDYLGSEASSSAARLALSLATLCSEALNESPDDPEAWLLALATVSEVEDSTKDVGA